jgi:hypothetical protein
MRREPDPLSDEFVGRTDELAAIEGLLAETRRGRRVGALLLVGEPGIGKSRLLDEAERRHRDGSILRFAGYEPESSVPLAAVSPLLRRIAAATEDRTFLGLLDPDAEVGGFDPIRIFESVHLQLPVSGRPHSSWPRSTRPVRSCASAIRPASQARP